MRRSNGQYREKHRIISNSMTNSNTDIRLARPSLGRVDYWLLLVLTCTLGLSPLSHAQGLTMAQDFQARALGATAAWPSTLSARRFHPLGLQTLSVEKQERKGQTNVRQAHLYQYHYGHQSARLLIVDLVDNSVIGQRRIDSVHLPLNDTEIDYARSLILQDVNVMQKLHEEQARRGQPPNTDLTELDVKASIFEPMDSLHPCSTQRCALLSLFDQTRTVFAVEPVVLLDTLQVQLLNPR